MQEKQGVDISGIISEENNTSANEPAAPATKEVSEKEILESVMEQDPLMASILSQIFDMGRIIEDLMKRITHLENVGAYLLSKDGDIMKSMAEADGKQDDQKNSNT